jgi:hypothetical protein
MPKKLRFKRPPGPRPRVPVRLQKPQEAPLEAGRPPRVPPNEARLAAQFCGPSLEDHRDPVQRAKRSEAAAQEMEQTWDDPLARRSSSPTTSSPTSLTQQDDDFVAERLALAKPWEQH